MGNRDLPGLVRRRILHFRRLGLLRVALLLSQIAELNANPRLLNSGADLLYWRLTDSQPYTPAFSDNARSHPATAA